VRARVIIGAVLFALAGGVFWWASQYLEPVKERIWVGFRGEAARNQFLAAELFMARQGFEVSLGRSIARLTDLPPRSTAVLPEGRQALSDRHVEHLMEWVRAGGHLLVQAERDEVDDLVLTRVGVRLAERKRFRSRETGDDGPSTAEDRAARDRDGPDRADGEERKRKDAGDGGTAKSKKSAKPTSCASNDRLADIKLPHVHETMIVNFTSERTFRIERGEPDFQWNGRQGMQVVSMRHGSGRVTVLPTIPFTNQRIDAHDHAALLYYLARWDGRADVLRFFDRLEKLSILSWLTEHALAVLFASGTLVALWLWRVSLRFGPIASDPLPVRLRLLDHLAASGRFQWRHGNQARLFQSARDEALMLINRVAPGFAALDIAKQVDRLRELAGFTEEEAANALRATPTGNAEFLHLIRLYQRLHATLQRRHADPAQGTLA
jgi:hypothetical protein